MKCVFCKIELEPYFVDYESVEMTDSKPQTYYKQQVQSISWTEKGRLVQFFYCPCCGYIEDRKS